MDNMTYNNTSNDYSDNMLLITVLLMIGTPIVLLSIVCTVMMKMISNRRTKYTYDTDPV